ncbi:tol-pal system protein YbgF [Abyssibacter profundi]|uniref:Cell division coordinator CpoB n=1 Tax=Abyssibacter profundi TaxID=2182787 RepID=A0A363UPQ9_9GAMM|nr:tol-pal system protein YbgF [Abyssibacter profundi]MBV62594.1 tol-pal system protein YbgF [Nevskiales bacterium]PWN57468.1 tol-pal system protein YbgF [Abyssibacter profundi]
MKSRIPGSLALLAIGSLASGCASFGSNEPSPEQLRLNALEQRAERVDRRLENLNLVQVAEAVDGVEAKMRELRGEVERLSYELEASKRRERQLYLDIDKRLQRLEQSGVGALAGSASPDGTAQVSAAEVASDPEIEKAYVTAFDLLKAGKFDAAIRSFQSFRSKYPNSVYADNAQYWLGEAYYVKQEYGPANEAFVSMIQRYPDSPKVPDALLKSAYIDYEQGNFGEARATLQQVLEQHPNASAASLARQRLDRMDREGR